MRDHWRDEGNRREEPDRWGRQRERSIDRRRSPAASRQPERSIDVEVKIRGRASIAEGHRFASRKHEVARDRESSVHAQQRASRSPQRRKLREGSHEYYSGLSEERYRHRSHHHRTHKNDAFDRRRSRTRSPHRKSPGPYPSRHTGRGFDTRTRHRGSHHSRPSTPRGADYYASSHEDNPSLAGDFYIPPTRRHPSRSPVGKDYRDIDTHKRRSPASRATHTRHRRPLFEEDDLFYNHPSRRRIRSPDTSRQSRASSRGRYQKPSHIKRSPDHSREPFDRRIKKARPSQSPIESDERRRSRMHSTHRIQVLDSTSRPQSPPRPIPTIDSGSQTSGSFPMHGISLLMLTAHTGQSRCN